ncbi:MAG: UDP-N-acetylmuramoyl-L-alanyl-D-glutamate--2,6-diaminopimelate ligase [Chloroflexota bacterium]
MDISDLLLSASLGTSTTLPLNPTVTAITSDSRKVTPGSLFVALTGEVTDGHKYIPDALDKGAVAIVGEADMLGVNIPYIRVRNSHHALALLAAAFHDWPARKLTVIGVTGTDGKTTTSNLIYHILLAAGIRAGMITTVNAVIGDEVLDTGFHVTTPESPDVQAYLAKMVEAGLTHVVLEATSHGLAQYRVDACEFDIGVVTNITHEHLDYHGSYENYRAAKTRLFLGLTETREKPQGNPRLAVLNRDDSSFAFLDRVTEVHRVSYGMDEEAEFRAGDISLDRSGLKFAIQYKDICAEVQSNLVGKYNVSNCLAALAATVVGLGIDPQVAARGVASLPGVPGRMERIYMGQGFAAVVDFAHTPNALKSVIETARQMLALDEAENEKRESLLSAITVPRIITVFGSAGLRDKEKRCLMAEISEELADLTILTAEDPRTESLEGILEEMAAGARSRHGREGVTFWRIPDRGAAIRFAAELARPGDIVLFCGKGHEQSMCFGAREFPWDDRTAVRAALAGLLGVDGPQMPYLPTQDTPESEWLNWK